MEGHFKAVSLQHTTATGTAIPSPWTDRGRAFPARAGGGMIAGMNHYLLIYHLAPGYPERRGEFRDAHLELVWAACERGEMLLAGAVENPMDTAMLLFAADGPETAEAFALADPYVTEGLVERWSVRRWMTVAGDGAASPLRPGPQGL